MGNWTSTPVPRAGADWYADPEDPSTLRYWDGRQWTHHTSPRPPGWRVGTTKAVRSGMPGWAIVLLVLFVGMASLVVLGAVMSAVSSDPDQGGSSSEAGAAAPTLTPSSAPTQAETSAPEPTPTETEPPRSVVPRLTGMSQEEAEELLSTAGLEVRGVRQVFSSRPAGTVLSQSKKVGLSVLTGTEVLLVVAKPYPQVPKVVGLSKSEAVSRLQEAGFKVDVTTETRTSGKDGVVLRQTPAGAVRAKPDTSVTVVVANVVRPVVEAPTQNCTAGYDPCLAPASDYDCAGGSGDGPKYTGYVVVTGPDPYDLDADGDGVACES
jgi:hypothetical protein